MIRIELLGHPAKGLATYITAAPEHDGDRDRWELEVWHQGFLRTRDPDADRTLTTRELLLELFRAGNGSADEFVRTFLEPFIGEAPCTALLGELWDAHRANVARGAL